MWYEYQYRCCIRFITQFIWRFSHLVTAIAGLAAKTVGCRQYNLGCNDDAAAVVQAQLPQQNLARGLPFLCRTSCAAVAREMAAMATRGRANMANILSRLMILNWL